MIAERVPDPEPERPRRLLRDRSQHNRVRWFWWLAAAGFAGAVWCVVIWGIVRLVG